MAKSFADSIGAGANGGFSGPKAVAMSGHTLFVADFDNNRVLRFTGPFLTPNQVYVATGIFRGLSNPVDVAVHGDQSLLVTDQGNQRIARYNDAVFSPSRAAPTSVFATNMGPEPLGVAADRAGRIYIADYRRYRVLIRDEFVRKLPITPNSTAKAKALLADLHARASRTTNRVAIGQQLITWEYGAKSNPNAWYGDWLQMQNGGYPLPEIMAGETSDLMSYTGFAPNQAALNELIRHGKAGHIVSLVWHPANPVPGGNFSTPISTANLRNMINDGTTAGQRWQTQLNRAAAVLQKFKAAGVPVVFRPLHEQNGTFFWWGHNGASQAALQARQAAWAAMWRDMVKELTVNKGLNNLVFVFGTNQVNYSEVAPPLTYYPGSGSADAVSIDIYDEELDLAGNGARAPALRGTRLHRKTLRPCRIRPELWRQRHRPRRCRVGCAHPRYQAARQLPSRSLRNLMVFEPRRQSAGALRAGDPRCFLRQSAVQRSADRHAVDFHSGL